MTATAPHTRVKRELRLIRRRVETARPVEAPECDELRLLARVCNHDRQAFEELYRIYEVKLSRFLANVLRQPQIAEEVLDDTLLVVWDRAASFKGESKLSTWIFAIAYRKAMKALRRYSPPVEDKDGKNRLSEADTPEEAYGHKQLHELLRRAMGELSPDHRAVVELTYFSDLGYREIAEIMECPVDTVKTRMFYARRHLKRCLDGKLQDLI
jgi:RNA polymerase sigma factor (sigma-70 family)